MLQDLNRLVPVDVPDDDGAVGRDAQQIVRGRILVRPVDVEDVGRVHVAPFFEGHRDQ